MMTTLTNVLLLWRQLILLVFIIISMISADSSSTGVVVNDVRERVIENRNLIIRKIAGFTPKTNVSDHASIDLDQQLIEKYIDTHTDEGFDTARTVYERGAYSRSYAVLTLEKGLPADVKQFTRVEGYSRGGDRVVGTVRRRTEAGRTELDVLYDLDDDDDPTTGCYVGGNPEPVTDECFTDRGGAVTIDGLEGVYAYRYNASADNRSERTIRSMSVNAHYKQRPCGTCEYFQEFEKFAEYYGKPAFANKFIESAFDGTKISFKHGDWDFTHYDREARAEAIRTATANICIAQYVLRDLEEAFVKCEHRRPCSNPPCRSEREDLHLMEGAYSFYAGSLEGDTGQGQGLLQYDIADRLCVDFKTCGDNGYQVKGTSKVNIEMLQHFYHMQDSYLSHKCTDARKSKDRVAQLLTIPLIQGTLKQAYINHNKPGASLTDEAIGASFAFGIIPVVAKCNQNDARIIYDNMKPNREFDTDFVAVKGAFERNYPCMRITCEDVGGYSYNGMAGHHYYEGAEPCHSEGWSDPDARTPGQIAAITIAAVFGTLLACCCYGFWKLPRKGSLRNKKKKGERGEVVFAPPPSTTGEMA